jgi:hypothetical protein
MVARFSTSCGSRRVLLLVKNCSVSASATDLIITTFVNIMFMNVNGLDGHCKGSWLVYKILDLDLDLARACALITP